MMMELPAPAFTNVLDQALDFIYGLEPYIAPTVVLVPSFLKGRVQALSEKIGSDVESLNYTLGLFHCYPLGMVMNMLPYGQTRHVFSFLSGTFLLQFTLGIQWIHQLITSLVVYILFLVLPRKTAKTVVPVFVMLYCVLGHLHRQYINYLGWDLDFTGPQMILTQKLYMMAYNLYDGEMLASGRGDDRATNKCSHFALRKLPNLIEYLGYTFSFSNILAGPAYEFSSYCSSCDGSLLYTPGAGEPRGKIPSNVWPTLRPFLTSLIALGAYLGLQPLFPLLDPDDPQRNVPVVLRPEFLKKPWHIRYGYLWMSLLVLRQKYYFAWKNAEGASNIWYAGFEGFDENGNVKGWDISDNVNIIKCETGPNLQTLTRQWNKKTSLWLTRYVYIRTDGSLLAVYSLSAFWHGFYPGYYLCFLSIPLVTLCERLGREKVSPRFSPSSWSLYDIVCRIVTSLVGEYMVSAIQLLALDWSWENWKSHYFFGHIGCILFYAVVSQIPTPKKKTA